MSSNLKVNTILPSTGTTVTVSGISSVTSSISAGSSITGTTFYGSGANLTSLPSQVTISSNADNRVITGGSGTNLNGEANLTFTGSRLNVGTSAAAALSAHVAADDLVVGGTSSHGITILTGDATGNIFFNNGSGNNGIIQYVHSTNPDSMIINSAGQIEFDCNGAERLRIDASGNLFLRSASANYLVMGSSGDATTSGVTNNMNWIRGNGNNTQYNTSGGFHAWEVSGNERARITSAGHAYYTQSVGIQTGNIDAANLANPVGAGHSLVGLYIGDGSLMFSSALSRTGGYYISTDVNALNAGPVTLNSNMKLDGTWVIV